MKNKTIGSLIMGLVISIAALYLAFKNVPFNQLIIYMGKIDYLWIIPTIGIILISFALRALRWQIIVKSAFNINFKSAFHPVMIGFMINCVLPARIGEIARPIILQKNNKVPFSTGLATVAAERVFDILFLLALFAGVLAKIDIAPDFEIKFNNFHLNKDILQIIVNSMIKLSIILITGIIILSINKARNFIIKCMTGIISIVFVNKKINQKLSNSLEKLINNFANGFILLKSPLKIINCIGISALIWGLQALSYYIFSMGCPGIGLSFTQMSAVMVLICFFIALPSVPGYWGLWEAGGVFAMSLFGVFQKEAAGFTLVNHAVQVFPVIILGFISAMLAGINILNISYEKTV